VCRHSTVTSLIIPSFSYLWIVDKSDIDSTCVM